MMPIGRDYHSARVASGRPAELALASRANHAPEVFFSPAGAE